jgi:MscS family membrane protein
LGILILIFLGFSIYKMLNFVFERLISQTLSRLGYKNIARNFILPIAKPFSLLVIFFLMMILVPVLQLPAEISRYVIKGLRGFWPLFATLIFYHLVDILGIYLQQVAIKTDSTLDDQLVPLLRKTLKAFVIIVGGLFILQNLDFNITALLAGLSIGGLAFALAAQDTIKNFFGSLMIFIDKPFQIGHWITAGGGDIDGTVEEVGFRSTRIRTFRNSVTYVPNGKLADMIVDNHGLRQYRRFYTQISITYDTPPELIEIFVEGLKTIVMKHPETRKDYFNIYLNDLASYSLNIMFYVFFEVPTWPEELKARHELILEVIKLAEKLNVRFAFPTQTLHMETFPEKKPLTPGYQEDMSEVKARAEAFLNSSKEG